MSFDFALPPRSLELADLRREVREFLAENIDHLPAGERARTWHGVDAEFSRKVGARGWIGMTMPVSHGGHGRTALERYVVLEELVSAGAPVGLHWSADRQSGPLLIKHGTENQQKSILPGLIRGEIYFCIGLSEPDAGSDLANLCTRAVRVEGGWLINGTKIWTSGAHLKHYMIMLCRTRPREEKRHAGMSQFLIDLSIPGIQIRPIRNMAGDHYFNEVVFTDCFVPDDALIGEEGNGWKQAMDELALERSGPERFLTSSILLRELVRMAGKHHPASAPAVIGRLSAHLVTLRRMSFSVANAMQEGMDVGVAGSFVKDLGSVFEQEIPDQARMLFDMADVDDDDFEDVFRYVMLASPSFSIYGGTREILRSIVGKSLAV